MTMATTTGQTAAFLSGIPLPLRGSARAPALTTGPGLRAHAQTRLLLLRRSAAGAAASPAPLSSPPQQPLPPYPSPHPTPARSTTTRHRNNNNKKIAPRACGMSDAIELAAKSAATPAPPSAGHLAARYAAVRGADIEPVSAALTRFTDRFARPVPIVYRGLINEIIVSTHLERVCAMWRYCPVFALGLDDVFVEFLRFYPSEQERDALYAAVTHALRFETEQIRADAAAVRAWCLGKTEQDVFDAAKAGAGPVGTALAQAARGFPVDDWFYSRLFGVGLIRVMAAVGVELTVTDMERWTDTLQLPKNKLAIEMATYISTTERLKQAEQMFAEIAARDARKTAERLAEKAKAAKAAADALEDPAAGGPPDRGDDKAPNRQGDSSSTPVSADAKSSS